MALSMVALMAKGNSYRRVNDSAATLLAGGRMSTSELKGFQTQHHQLFPTATEILNLSLRGTNDYMAKIKLKHLLPLFLLLLILASSVIFWKIRISTA